MITTRLTARFGLSVPGVLAPMDTVADGRLAGAVTRAGGMGVLGCVRFNDPDELESVLCWMDANTDGKPYGVDVVMPMKVPTRAAATW